MFSNTWDSRLRAGSMTSGSEMGVRGGVPANRSEEHTSELQSQSNLVCRLLLEKKNKEFKLPMPIYWQHAQRFFYHGILELILIIGKVETHELQSSAWKSGQFGVRFSMSVTCE